MQQPTSTYRSGQRAATVKWLWLACLIAFSALYLATCQRGVSWQDSGTFQWRVRTGDYEGDLGLALAHPLLIAAGQALKPIPIADLATRLNFFSGLGMAVAMANLACLIAVLTGRRWIGAATAAMLSVAHTPWWLATITETYTWTAAGLTAELWLLVSLIRKPRAALLIAIALVSGLGLNLHNLALLPLPVYAVAAIILVLRRKLPAWSLAAAAGAYCLGAGPYIAMTVRLALHTADLPGAIHSALFGNYAKAVFNVSASSKYYQANAVLAAMNFVSFLGPLAVVGWAHLRRKLGGATASALAAITIIEVLFVIRYPVPDQFTFLLPTLVMVALAAGIGISVLADASARLRKLAIASCVLSIVVPPSFYAVAPSLANWSKLAPRRQRELPFRDELRYWLVPWKHNEHSAEMFARAALMQAGPDGVIVSDSTAVHPLLLVQARDGLSRGVSVEHLGRFAARYAADPEAFRKALGKRKLYAVSRDTLPGRLLKDADFPPRAKDAALYLARWKKP